MLFCVAGTLSPTAVTTRCWLRLVRFPHVDMRIFLFLNLDYVREEFFLENDRYMLKKTNNILSMQI